jgi:ribose transport system substrate-binding protein
MKHGFRVVTGVTVLGLAIITGLGAGVADSEGRATTRGADIKYASAQVAAYKALPKFTLKRPAFNARAARGKHLFVLPTSSSIPFVVTIEKGMRDVAKRFGITYTEYSNKGGQPEWTAGINQAIARKPDLLALVGSPLPSLLQPQLKAAKKAGLKILDTNFFPDRTPKQPNIDALVTAPFAKAAQLMADWTIVDSNGKATVAIVTDRSVVPAAPLIEKAFAAELRKRCSTCTLARVVNIPFLEAATKLQTAVASELTSNPSINYIVPVFDLFAQWVGPGIVSAGRTGKVKIVTFNGSPFALKMIQDNQHVAMDVGQDLAWLGWANMDQAMRLMTGRRPLAHEPTPLRIFDRTNVHQAGNPPVYDRGYGNAYKKGYLKLWGAAK